MASDGKQRRGTGRWHLPFLVCVQGLMLPITQQCLISQWEGREMMLHGPI